MKSRFFYRLVCSILLMFSSAILLASPPHPDILKKIMNGEIPIPYNIEHYRELQAKGVNSGEGITPPTLTDEDYNILVLLVDFSDDTAQTNETLFDTLIYEQQSGTLVDYYEEVTFGNWTIVTVNLPSSTGWFRAPDTSGYYINGQMGMGDYPQNAQKLVEDLVVAADPVINFAPYDNDSDDYVDALIVVHAGQSTQTTGSNDNFNDCQWWTHEPIPVDGVEVYIFIIVGEYLFSPGDRTIGTFAHEIGHGIFGLPDLYDIDLTSYGIGFWGLMGYGMWNGNNGDSPSHPSAWSRMRMGIMIPNDVTSDLIGATITAAEIDPTAYRLWTNGWESDEYFLIENRQPIGYDSELPEHGLLIYHVDDTVSTQNKFEWYPGHTESGHYLVALEQADGNWDLEHNTNKGDAGDPYPGSTNNTVFSDTTIPDSRGYDFGNSAVAVTNIGPSATYMTADLIVETDFVEHVISSHWTTLSLLAEDIDDDGDKDILTGGDGYDWQDISWWENDSDGNFTEHIISDSADAETDDVFAADVDSDGDMDVLGVSRSTRYVRWFENNGNQNFTEHIIAEDIWDVNSVCAADLDGDLDIDIVCASDESYEAYIIWWENDGGENFTQHTVTLQDYALWDVLAVDLDGDWDVDILACGYNLTWWENDGNGNFTEHIIDEYYWARAIDVANVDGDGDLDILAAWEDEDKIVWWENDGNQNFTQHIIGENFDGAYDVFAVDIDNDLDIDVLGAAYSDDRISLWKNDGNQNFSEQVIANYFNEANSIYAGDIDGDGDPDIIGGAENCYYTEPSFCWWENMGTYVQTAVLVELTPLNPPIIIPPSGGTFDFNIALENTTNETQTFDFWSKVNVPNYGFVEIMNVPGFTLPALISINRDRRLLVPGGAPGGEYTMYAYVGDYPDIIEHQDFFTFTKSGADNPVFILNPEEWICTGDPFFDEPAVELNIPYDYSFGCSPNPFNQRVALDFALPASAPVKLAVYDVLGREVVKLVDEYRIAGSYKVLFDAKDLVSGVYFVRLDAGDFSKVKKMVLMK